MNDRCTLYNGHPSLEIVSLVFPTNYVVVVINLYVLVILMKSYHYYCYHQTKKIFFNRKRTLYGLNIVSRYMTTLLYTIHVCNNRSYLIHGLDDISFITFTNVFYNES